MKGINVIVPTSGLIAAFLLGTTPAAGHGYNHARAEVGLCISSQLTNDNTAANASCHVGSKYRIVHEEIGYNSNTGNAGNGHAHHHKTIFGLRAPAEGEGAGGPAFVDQPPPIGSPGSLQYLKQSWLPNRAGDHMTVTWSPQNFLQIDLTELTRANMIVSNASIASDGGLAGSVEVSAWLDPQGLPQTSTKLTGILKGKRFELATRGKIVTFQFREPLAWTVPGKVATFDTTIDGAVTVRAKSRL